VVGAIGFVLIAIGIWQGYAAHGTPEGHYLLAGTIFFTVILIAMSLRSKTWNRVMLHTEIDGKANVIEENAVRPGDTGKSSSRLIPMGKALINNEYYEVSTYGEVIDPGTEITVVRIENNKIFVKSSN
jgi:membrane-bound ClpP family serine protease